VGLLIRGLPRQGTKFCTVSAARELGTDDDEARFNEKLRKLVKPKPDDKKPSGD